MAHHTTVLAADPAPVAAWRVRVEFALYGIASNVTTVVAARAATIFIVMWAVRSPDHR